MKDLNEYNSIVKPGMLVELRLPSGKITGEAGNLWGEEGAIPVLRFMDGSVARVSEVLVQFAYLPIAN